MGQCIFGPLAQQGLDESRGKRSNVLLVGKTVSTFLVGKQ